MVAWPDIQTWPNATMALFYINETMPEATPNLVVRGPGVIDGQGWRWSVYPARDPPTAVLSRTDNGRSSRWPHGKTIPRPILLKFIDVVNLTLTNVVLRDSPAFHILVQGEHVGITQVRIEANLGSCGGYNSAPNTGKASNAGPRSHRTRSAHHSPDSHLRRHQYRWD